MHHLRTVNTVSVPLCAPLKEPLRGRRTNANLSRGNRGWTELTSGSVWLDEAARSSAWATIYTRLYASAGYRLTSSSP